MANLTYGQLRMYAQAAGMAQPDIAAAVAMAESSGNPRAHNPIPPDNSYGLWQINMLGGMGPERRRALGISSNTQLFDPATNARAAAMISGGGRNWKPWSTYTNGAYKKYLQGTGSTGGQQPADWDPSDLLPGPFGPLNPLIPLIPEGGDVLGGLDGLADVADSVLDAGNWIANPRNWIRVAYAVIGGGLILVGLNVMVQAKIIPRAGKLLSSGADYVPQGRALKTAGAARKAKVASQVTAARKAAAAPKPKAAA